jgi:predicted nucleic acid-binding protein
MNPLVVGQFPARRLFMRNPELAAELPGWQQLAVERARNSSLRPASRLLAHRGVTFGWETTCPDAVWRAHGEKAAAAKLHEIAQLRVFDVDMELAKLATSLRAQDNLPYADCFAAALAQARKATLVTSDKDFERVGIAFKILWV